MARPPLRLRQRVMLLFAALACGASVAVLGALWIAGAQIGDRAATRPLVLAAAISVSAILGLSFWAWLQVDERGVRLLDGLARLLQTVTHANASGDNLSSARGDLGALGPAAGDMVAALKQARAELATARAEAAAHATEQRERLEAVLRDLDEAVLICSRGHRIMLYNNRAAALLGEFGELGLGRSLAALLDTGPIDHALARMDRTTDMGGSEASDPEPAGADGGRDDTAGHDATGSATAVCATLDARRFFRCRITRLPSTTASPQRMDTRRHNGSGLAASVPTVHRSRHVVTLRDITADLLAKADRDRQLVGLLATARIAANDIASTIDKVLARPDDDRVGRRELEQTVAARARALTDEVDAFQSQREQDGAGAWPVDDMPAQVLLAMIAAQEGCQDLSVRRVPGAVRCDSLSVATLFAAIVAQVRNSVHRDDWFLDMAVSPSQCVVTLAWRGDPVLPGEIDAWLDEPLPRVAGSPSGHAVLLHHQTGLYADTLSGGQSCVKMPLPPGVLISPAEHQSIAQRPEFYDFDLEDVPHDDDLDDTPLTSLTYVVFDTETTGLEPARGDELVQIAGVRIVNGRVLLSETFDTLVDPARSVPPSSTAIHGITPAMLEGAPPVAQALQRFHRFAADSVLIAHNAAFDMAFLRREKHGVPFGNRVLDTVLLSAWLHDHTGRHSLDDLAERFDVEIDETVRHTAIGDALATAQIFVKLIPLLHSRGVHTLGQALQASHSMRSIRRQQARYGRA